MSGQTRIEWTDTTWNPVRGCSRVSAGCQNCYAERQAIRQIKSGYAGLIQRTSHGPAWTGEVRLVPELLDAPLRWRKPRRIFVNSMSDLFHERLPDEAILQVFDVMRQCANGWTGQIGGKLGQLVPAHTFQILTKRPARMLDFCRRLRFDGTAVRSMFLADDPSDRRFRPTLPNVWLGVSVENQATADERLPLLMLTPTRMRFVSYEPALGPVDFRPFVTRLAIVRCPRCGYSTNRLHEEKCPNDGTILGPDVALDWLIVGGESGPGARPCHVAWIRSAVEECKAAGVPCFVKQLGANVLCEWSEFPGWDQETNGYPIRDRKGGDPAEWPAYLRVREMPAC